MTYTIVFLIVVALVLAYWFLLRPRVLRARRAALDSAGTTGTQLGRTAVKGPAAKHRAMLARTLTLDGDADTTRALIDRVIAGNDRVEPVGKDSYQLDGGYPKMTVQAGPKSARLAVSEFVYAMSFPQGGKAWRGLLDAVAQASTAHGLTVHEGSQEFVQADSSGNHSELWFSIPRSTLGQRRPPVEG